MPLSCTQFELKLNLASLVGRGKRIQTITFAQQDGGALSHGFQVQDRP